MTGLLALNGCAHVKIYDHEFCADAGSQGGICFHTLTSETRDIPEPTWDDFRFGQICEDSGTFADLKRVTEQLCSVSNACDYGTKKKLNEFFSRVKTTLALTFKLRNL